MCIFFPKFGLGFKFSLGYNVFSIYLSCNFFLNGIFISKVQLFQVKMAPKAKDSAWVHCDVIDGKLTCNFCDKSIGGGAILRLKQHLAGIRGQVKPCEVPNEVLGPIRA